MRSKEQLPVPVVQPGVKNTNYRKIAFVSFIVLLSVASYTRPPKSTQNQTNILPSTKEDALVCYQPPILFPQANNQSFKTLKETYGTEQFLLQAVDWLAGAVRVETESYDDMGPVGEDVRWDKFAGFHTYLENAFPRVFGTMNVKKVDTYGLVLEWPGNDESLKPILLTAHQDVVPVLRPEAWKFPPYSGHWDGEFVYGRGTGDDKSGLIGILSSLETIISETSFQPSRSIVVAAGIDEESAGVNAQKIGVYLEEKYGKKSFALLVDEGSGYTVSEDGLRGLAQVSSGEKGHLDVTVRVDAVGGHAALPPTHTSIGLLSLLVAQIESHPFQPNLTRENPFYSQLFCMAEYSDDLLPEVKELVYQSQSSDDALVKLGSILGKDGRMKNFFTTTGAVDLISGGVKANALPETAEATIDYRTTLAHSPKKVMDFVVETLSPTVQALNLTLTAFGEEVISKSCWPSSGHVTLLKRRYLDPASVTPTGEGIGGWELLSGSIKAAFGSQDMIVTPSFKTGSTDTKSWSSLANQIYRFSFLSDKDLYMIAGTPGTHSSNEAIRGIAFLKVINFYTTLILNADEFSNLDDEMN